MRKTNRTSTCYWQSDTSELEYEIVASISPYVPAKVSGPPEDCYPEEGGEVDDVEIFLDGKPVKMEDFLKDANTDEAALLDYIYSQDDGDDSYDGDY